MIFNLPTFFIICFFVPFCISLNWPVNQEFTLKDSTPVTGSFRVNLIQHASIIISHQSDVGVCFQRLFEVPAVESYNYCTIFIPLHTPPVPSQVPVPAPDLVPAPSRVPSQVPVPNPGSVPIPSSVPVPNPESVPIPSSVPVPNPGSVPIPSPDSVPAPIPGSVPVPNPGSVPVPAPSSGSVPVPNPDSVPVPNPGSVPVPVPPPIPDSVPSPSPAPESTPSTFTTQQGLSKRSIISLQSLFNTKLGSRGGVVTPNVLDFTDEDIFFGIYFLDDGEHDPETLQINFTGSFCNSSQIFNGNNCEQPYSKLENNQTFQVRLSYLQPIFFSIDIPERTRQFTVFAIPTIPGNTAHVYLRYQGTPSNVTHDAQGLFSATLDLPETGTWYIRVVYDFQPGSSDFRVRAKFNQCGGNGVGITCNDSVIADVTKLDVWDIKPYQWVYYKFISTPTNPLNVSVQTQPGSPPVQLFASIDQVPTFNRSDLKGCNQPNCESTTIILVNSTTITKNLTWYIGIVSSNDTSFGIWFSSVCAPNCYVNGKCTYSGVNTGKCVCGDPYSGFDCLTDNGGGLRPQYIVLIIIASLVLAAVIIGLIAWVYMQRRQKSNYTEVRDE